MAKKRDLHMKNFHPKSILALGGGGARGLAHIGVLQVFEEEGIKFDAIIGTSMGAIIGGYYAQRGTISELNDMAKEYIKNSAFLNSKIKFFVEKEGKNSLNRMINFLKQEYVVSKLINKKYIVSGEKLNKAIANFIADDDLKNFKIFFVPVSVDLDTGKPIGIEKGPAVKAIQASASIPGIFEPVKWKNMELVDGGVVSTIPVHIAMKYRPKTIVAVSVDKEFSQQTLENGVELLGKVEEITNYQLNLLNMSLADVILRPDVEDISWADFSRIDDFIEAGRIEARSKIMEIKKAMQLGKSTFNVKRFFRWSAIHISKEDMYD
jgi:NTE family protein